LSLEIEIVLAELWLLGFELGDVLTHRIGL
jgi:hypothetical protein